jgi:hypothetical protein
VFTGGGIVSAHLEQPRNMVCSFGHQPQAGKGCRQTARYGNNLGMTTVKVRSLMGKDGGQLWLGQCGKCGACDDDCVRSPGNAVGRGLWSINDYGVETCHLAADQAYSRGMPMSLAPHAHKHPHQSRCAERDCHGT